MTILNPLDEPVKYIKGVGPFRSKILAKIGIHTIRDLILYFPKEHEDRSTLKSISEVKSGETITLTGKVEISGIKSLGPRLSVFKAAVSDKSGIIFALFFKRPNYRYDVFQKLKKDFTPGSKIILHGKIEKSTFEIRIHVDEYEILKENLSDNIHTGRVVPIYPLTEGLNGRFLRQSIKTALEKYISYIEEILPQRFMGQLTIPSIRTAINQFHFPDSFKSLEEARKRIAFEEFLLLETALLISKKQNEQILKTRTYQVTGKLLKPFKKELGFNFTNSQKKVINEIFSDMQSSVPMNRLLIGDVGSGKTVVALSAALLAIENGFQAAVMAPTEILAEQHFYTVKYFLKSIDVKVALITGSTPAAEKKIIGKNLIEGKIDLIIGTHSLLEGKLNFKSLALIIIDEQHKFGVLQRQKLREKNQENNAPDVLVMTATPIPRTLALTIYGDLEVSMINELPPGRMPVKTLKIQEEQAYDFIKSEIQKDRQAYIVFPLIEESDRIELKSVMGEINNLKNRIFPEFLVDVLHGQMPGKQKEKIMFDFRDKKIEILVATTVVEIGIDVPNATVMAIEHSERFGLASLHQLRGRVGRAPGIDSYCLLLGEPQSELAKKRIEVMLSTNNGFEIGDMDLKLRGPGKFFGTLQHGLSEIRIGDISGDISIISDARKTALEIVKNDLLKTEKPFENALMRIYGKRLHFPRVG